LLDLIWTVIPLICEVIVSNGGLSIEAGGTSEGLGLRVNDASLMRRGCGGGERMRRDEKDEVERGIWRRG